MLVVSLLLPFVYAVEYVCDPLREAKSASLLLTNSIQTASVYPVTVTNEDRRIPVTLELNNYLFEDQEQAATDLKRLNLDPKLASHIIYHEIDVKVAQSPFDDLYTVCPAAYPGTDLYITRLRDNVNNLFRVRYSTTKGLSCLGTNLVQFKLFFVHGNDIYEYYFGNCNYTAVHYDGFNQKSLCIPYNFTCYDNLAKTTKCTRADYNLAFREMRSHNLTTLESGGSLSVSGAFPTESVQCLNEEPCTFSGYSTATFDADSFSTNTPLVVQITSSVPTVTSQNTSLVADTNAMSSSNLGNSAHGFISFGLQTLIWLFY